MVTNTQSDPRVFRQILLLSLGTGGVQIMAAVGQFLFVFWLTPVDYGRWATATSSLIVISALTNLGEVNAYLSSKEDYLSEARRAILKVNLALAAIASAFALATLLAVNETVGLLMVLVAINIPLAGDSGLLYAAYVKRRHQRHLVMAQWAAGTSRLAVGGLAAWLTGSPIAIGVSVCLYSLVLIVILRPDASQSRRTHSPSLRQRAVWGFQSISLTLTTQTDFLVASWLASTQTLGTYFFAYQLTVGISALVVLPLSKSVLAELATTRERDRGTLALQLIRHVSSAVALAAIGIGAVAMPLERYVSDTWHSAVPVMVILLGGLAARFVTPVVDACLLANQQWVLSTKFNLLDALGTGLAATVAIHNSSIVIAIATVSWKVCFGIFRLVRGLPGESWRLRIGGGAPIVISAASLLLAVTVGGPSASFILVLAAIICMYTWRTQSMTPLSRRGKECA